MRDYFGSRCGSRVRRVGSPFLWFSRSRPGLTPRACPACYRRTCSTRPRCAGLRPSQTRPEALHLIGLFSADVEPLAHPWKAWSMASIPLVLHRARESFHEGACLAHLGSQRGIQAALLSQRTLLDAERVHRVHLDRWRSLAADPPVARILPGRAATVLARPGHLPAAVRWALVRLWLNGVCTAGRFQNDTPCRLCVVVRDKIERWDRGREVRCRASHGLGGDDWPKAQSCSTPRSGRTTPSAQGVAPRLHVGLCGPAFAPFYSAFPAWRARRRAAFLPCVAGACLVGLVRSCLPVVAR